MSISSGRRPDPRRTPGAWRVRFALALIAASFVSAFAPPEPPAPPNAITPTLHSEIHTQHEGAPVRSAECRTV